MRHVLSDDLYSHHEEAIDYCLDQHLPRTMFIYKHPSGNWITSIHLPRASTYYSVTAGGEVFLNCPDDSKPIRVRQESRRS